ncbi:MAG: DUF4974 domain-containing protein [Prevotella sp.]|nr:DUF4974 domain-containing protein [Prevotella sp.]
MNYRGRDEKRMLLLDMQEHPEKYTDRQVRELLADDDIRQFAHYLAMTKRAMMRDEPAGIDVEAEWERFAAVRLPHRRSRMKVAASIVGIVFVSGLALAATVQFGFLPFFGSRQPVPPQPSPVRMTPADSLREVSRQRKATIDSLTRTLIQHPDSMPVEPVTFEDASLQTVATAMAQYYHAELKVDNPGAARMRLFFKWDRQATLQQNIDLLNGFDRVNLTYTNNTLTIE